MKIVKMRPVETELLHTVGRTDRQTDIKKIMVAILRTNLKTVF